MNLGFQTALSALNTAQRALQVVGHNLANASNPAYARQRVVLESLTPTTGQGGLFIGRGVDIGRIDRVADALLDDRIRTQQSEVSRQSMLRGHLQEIEAAFADPGPSGLSATMSSFFSSISAMTAAPEDASLRHGMVQGGLGLADTLKAVRRQLADVQGSFKAAVQTELDRVNTLAAELADLNEKISAMGQGGNPPAGFLDRQDEILRELSQHVDVQSTRDVTGRVTVVSGGNPLVSPRGVVPLRMVATGNRDTDFAIQGERSSARFEARSGSVKALQDLAESGLTDPIADLDRMARNLILEFNRRHATGVPSGGGFKDLTSSNSFRDMNNTGSVLDDTLGAAGLPFDIAKGGLTVNVTDEATGIVTRTQIAIDPAGTTVQQLRDALNGVSGIAATVDSSGRLRVTASSGKSFDFSNRVLPVADLAHTFGGQAATVTGSTAEPFTLANGQGFTLNVDGSGPQAVTFASAQFANIFQAGASEVAAAINSQISGATAEVVDGRVVIKSNSTGLTSTIQLADGAGAPLAALGLSTALDTGADSEVDVRLEGTYSGSADRTLVFKPLSAGTIGSTAGLRVEVRDAATNAVVGTLDVGNGYAPGSSLELLDGTRVSFGAGTLNPTAGDRFQVDLLARSDTSDVLAATGLGSFFTGSDAATIDVSRAVRASPSLITAGLSAAEGDGGNLLRLQAVRDDAAAGLGGMGVEAFHRDLIARVGGDSARSQATLETQSLVLDSLESRRQAVSGVNVDEELLMMEQFQQTYQVAARYLQAVQEVTSVLLNLAG